MKIYFVLLSNCAFKINKLFFDLFITKYYNLYLHFLRKMIGNAVISTKKKELKSGYPLFSSFSLIN
ncbi:hypothetical protein CBF29_02455 [Vagococcus elongatus]|uniref:Uncharacterized protein n=1 Tax=Vagococcus elongatus TaxID=180344 RepID=A0A430B4G1_9ENTE|nr:hypothetical protein CBF29_02455 [Vagococcus elongatus]